MCVACATPATTMKDRSHVAVPMEGYEDGKVGRLVAETEHLQKVMFIYIAKHDSDKCFPIHEYKQLQLPNKILGNVPYKF